MTQQLSTRQVAADLVSTVLSGKSWDYALDNVKAFKKLSPQDRGFTHHLAATCLRHYNYLNFVAGKLTGKGKVKPPKLAIILSIGLTQVLFMDVPDHASVNETVNIAPKPFRAVVNAVLRRALREKDQWQARDNMAQYAAPKWLYAQLRKDYGEKRAEAIILSCLKEPHVDLSLKNNKGRDQWIEKLDAVAHPLGASITLPQSGALQKLEGYETGDWWVQDAAAAYPISQLGDLSGKTILDMCAAPGGKAMQLASLGADVLALDVDPMRLKRMDENITRCGLKDQVTTICADALTYQFDQKFDIVLLDAPCSATGTLRRHPDMWVQQKTRDSREYNNLQKMLLNSVKDHVKSDGYLIYMTCSLDKAEGEIVHDDFLKSNPEFRSVDDRTGRILPDEYHTDGFFFALFAPQ